MKTVSIIFIDQSTQQSTTILNKVSLGKGVQTSFAVTSAVWRQIKMSDKTGIIRELKAWLEEERHGWKWSHLRNEFI